ncbi:hypothetical protein KGM_201349 [Danaus plexippus plexippus]|uniref:Uncharacterized protein n=1 Tax=Danaus plexippus plexippus TaxID=278856 RepID=A0A212FNN0_DANPL|nr:hypothetical protein KGM_201349 [Danaus plexippus plexippus]
MFESIDFLNSLYNIRDVSFQWARGALLPYRAEDGRDGVQPWATEASCCLVEMQLKLPNHTHSLTRDLTIKDSRSNEGDKLSHDAFLWKRMSRNPHFMGCQDIQN